MYNPPHPGGVVRRAVSRPAWPFCDAGGARVRCHASSVVRSCQRKSRHLSRNGLPPLESVRVEPGNVAWYADGL